MKPDTRTWTLHEGDEECAVQTLTSVDLNEYLKGDEMSRHEMRELLRTGMLIIGGGAWEVYTIRRAL